MWSGQQQQLCEVQSQFELLCREVDLSVLSQLSDVAALQFRVHSTEWMQHKSASYLKWLRQASAKGLRGLFRSVKAEEAVHLRPFLDQPLQDRIYLRWRQWFDLWSDPQGVDHELLNELMKKVFPHLCPPFSTCISHVVYTCILCLQFH